MQSNIFWLAIAKPGDANLKLKKELKDIRDRYAQV